MDTIIRSRSSACLRLCCIVGLGAPRSGGAATRREQFYKNWRLWGEGCRPYWLPAWWLTLPPPSLLCLLHALCSDTQRVLVAVKRVVDYAAKVRVKADKSGEWSAVMV
jgi:hypothetical protein